MPCTLGHCLQKDEFARNLPEMAGSNCYDRIKLCWVQCLAREGRADRKSNGLTNDDITQWSGQSLVSMVRMAEDRARYRRFIHEVAYVR